MKEATEAMLENLAGEASEHIADIENKELQTQVVTLLIHKLLDNPNLAPTVVNAVLNYLEDSQQNSVIVDPQEAEDAFLQLLSKQKSLKQGSPSRKPHRFIQIYSTIKGRENEDIPLEDFITQLDDTANSHLRASRDISVTNHALRMQVSKLQIVGTTHGYHQNRKTFYRLKHTLQW